MYRKYSDGWIEQGGLNTKTGSQTNAMVTFPLEFSNVNYCAVTSPYTETNQVTSRGAIGVKEKNQMGCISDNWTEPMLWYACGY